MFDYDRERNDAPGEKRCKQCAEYKDEDLFCSKRYPNLCKDCAELNKKEYDREKARTRRQKIKAENQAKRAAGK
jgi:hypothetical protein